MVIIQKISDFYINAILVQYTNYILILLIFVFFFIYISDTIAEEIEIPSVFTSFYASQILTSFIIPEQG